MRASYFPAQNTHSARGGDCHQFRAFKESTTYGRSGEIGDSSRTPETYFDTDRHPEHEDCRPMCFHINFLTAFPDAEWPNSSEESLPKKSAARSGSEAARSPGLRTQVKNPYQRNPLKLPDLAPNRDRELSPIPPISPRSPRSPPISPRSRLEKICCRDCGAGQLPRFPAPLPGLCRVCQSTHGCPYSFVLRNAGYMSCILSVPLKVA